MEAGASAVILLCRALCRIQFLTSMAVCALMCENGSREATPATSMASVATPAAMGVAIDVPDMTVISVLLSWRAARMPVPGAPATMKRGAMQAHVRAPAMKEHGHWVVRLGCSRLGSRVPWVRLSRARTEAHARPPVRKESLGVVDIRSANSEQRKVLVLGSTHARGRAEARVVVVVTSGDEGEHPRVRREAPFHVGGSRSGAPH